MVKTDIIVCDIGAHSIKLGFGGEEEPSLIVPCLLGTPLDGSKENLQFRKDASEHRNDVDLSYLFSYKENGSFVLKGSNPLEALIQTSITKLVGTNVAAFSDYKLFLARPSNMAHSDLEKLLNVFFHKMKFKAVVLWSEVGLVLKAHEQETGLVVEAGEGSIRLSPVFGGHFAGGSRAFPIAGRTLTRQLVHLLVQQGRHHFNPNRDLDLLRADSTNQSYCYAAPCYETEQRCAKETTLLLQDALLLDGTNVEMEKARFETVECLFTPTLIGKETKGLPAIIAELVTTGVDVTCRPAIFGNILLSGGTGRIPGLKDRLEHELRSHCIQEGLLSQERAEGICVSVAKDHAVFCGAAAIAELIGEQRKFWTTQSDYKREGATREWNRSENVGPRDRSVSSFFGVSRWKRIADERACFLRAPSNRR